MTLLLAITCFLISGVGIMFIYTDDYIPEPNIILWVAIISIAAYFIVKMVMGENKKQANRIMGMTTGIYTSLFLSSYLYETWTFNKLITNGFLMKVVLFLLLMLTLYASLFLFRMESSYKKKRGNQRIKEEPEQTLMEKWRTKKKNESNQDVYLVLGEQVETDEH